MASEPPSATSTKRLTRSRSDRVVAGVAGGLARYFSVDPVLFRIGFVVACFMGGSGLLLYAAGWLLVPEDDEDESIGQRMVRDSDTVKILLVAAAVVVLVPWLFVTAFIGFGRVDGVIVPVLLLAGVALWMSRDRDDGRDATTASSASSPPVGLDEPLDAPPPPPAAPAPPSASPQPPPPAAPRRRRPSITRLVLSLLVMAGGVAALLDQSGAFDIDLLPFLAFCLVVVGAGLAVGWRFGRVRGLFPLGVVLTIVLSIGAASDGVIDGGIGEEVHRPLTIASLHDEYRLGVGELVLDLRSLAIGSGTHEVDVDVGIGQIAVMLPPNVDYDIVASSGVGSVTLLGQSDDGFSAKLTAESRRPGVRGLLVMHIRTGIGEVVVTGAPPVAR